MGFYQNTCKPEGLGGKLMARQMNGGHHAKLAEWGFSHLTVPTDANILDAGCGGGANLARWLERCPAGHVTGLDYSEVSVETAKQYNRQAIADGRCDVVQGNVAELPFADHTFDVVSAFEMVYFWPGLEHCFAEIFRVLKPGGLFFLCNETDGKNPAVEAQWMKKIQGMQIYNKEQLRSALSAVGFLRAEGHANPALHWICLLAKKEISASIRKASTVMVLAFSYLFTCSAPLLRSGSAERSGCGGSRYRAGTGR